MENLVYRYIDETEAKRLGIPNGWYGTRVSGTLMTKPCLTQAECLDAIAQLPDEAVVISDAAGKQIPSKAEGQTKRSLFTLGPAFVTARQVGYKPSRQGNRR